MADEESNMALLEIGMISGYAPDRTSLHALLENPDTKVKRFEDDHDLVTIYFDKLTGQKLCISFTVTRENVVDRLEPANVKLYDYYQQELTISTNYNFAQLCSSADISEEPAIPNPMPVETKSTLVFSEYNKNTSMEHDKEEKSSKNFGKESGNVKNKVASSVKDLDGKEHDTVAFAKENENKTDDVKVAKTKLNNPTESPDQKTNNDNDNANVKIQKANTNNRSSDTSQVDTGSGQSSDDLETSSTPTVDEIFDNPSFVVVNHELDTPDGIEGPVPVYVKPSITNFKENSSFDEVYYKENDKVDIESITQEDYKIDVQSNSSDSTNANPVCPICANELPEDINDIYCSATSAVKVAIRRLRKARLLLDFRAMRYVKRLRSTVELVLNPGCSCPPLDNPGSLALLLRSAGDDFATLQEHGKQILDNTVSIYGLPSNGGVPPRIIEAKSQCLKEAKSESDDRDTSLGD
ncbi:hypothetical protein KPH14_001788 [Odynerus spinipes]|uniref:Alpha-macroglobulin receptor-binding domain-containing protein n=1 Tax=Odynerus spinipes TaxID=1348599 RepID=A0AAD9VVW9_9HYME|nr:hypothetical protein KPH14_001788 [Odynerus spinipes]